MATDRVQISNAAVGLVTVPPAGVVTVRRLPVTHTVLHQVSCLVGCSPIRFKPCYNSIAQQGVTNTVQMVNPNVFSSKRCVYSVKIINPDKKSEYISCRSYEATQFLNQLML